MRKTLREINTEAKRPNYSIVSSIDAFVAQVTRLAGTGYYFCFFNELKAGKDPAQLDRVVITEWDLDQPYWRREKRHRGAAPSIWYMRCNRKYLLMSTRGRGDDGTHRFFSTEVKDGGYGNSLFDIRRNALYYCGYSIRYPLSMDTGKHQAFVRLDKTTEEHLRRDLTEKAIRQRYREREAIEAEFRRIPYQPYGPVYKQLVRILKTVNALRGRYVGFAPARIECIPKWRRTSRVYEDGALCKELETGGEWREQTAAAGAGVRESEAVDG